MITRDIRINANAIWNLLSEKGSITIREISELTNFKESLILLALGWLSRENKITFSDRDGVLEVSLKSVLTDIYY
ncbi:winged helix-turn-helix domain-containing protein [Dysgonomonas sp. Marseille-P4361]|uniref:winged helix-turn-helix domain-containing protein n=1 Tax=Dysgonomonas sp. Marseille-P4361 TaxID=2161820 RepID=UPI000D55AB39|nr:winged helix-turn-helix domain-containing protein [Dysgonomonas sp. Marseille-P4361]